jgi:hypothetical protein
MKSQGNSKRPSAIESQTSTWVHVRPVLLWLAALGILVALAHIVERLPTQSARDAPPAPPDFYPPPGRYDSADKSMINTASSTAMLIEIRSAQHQQDGQPRPMRLPSYIIFTTDGTLPTLDVGTRYERPLSLDMTYPSVTVLRAIEVINGKPGPVAQASYVVGVPTNLPILSLITEPTGLWDSENGIFVKPWERGREWERPVHLTFLEEAAPTSQSRSFEVSAGLRVHGSGNPDPSQLLEIQKRSLRLYFRTRYGASRLEAELFSAPDNEATPPDQAYDRLLLHAGHPTDFNTLLCDHLTAEVAAELGLPAAKGRFVIMFINGELWGIYRLSERVDRFFLEDNLNIQNADVVQEGRAREGTDDDWDALIDWVETHDLSNPEHYAYVQTQIDLKSFTDFAALQLYFGFSPEALFAVHPRGGRWFWVYAGGTQTFANHADAPIGLLTDAATSPLAPPAGTSDFAVLLKKLLTNPQYRSRFTLRFADLLNTTLSARSIAPRIARLTQTLAPNIDYEISRWPQSLQDWSFSTARWATFATERTMGLRKQFAHVLGVAGTATLTFSVQPPESGRIYINGIPMAAGDPDTPEPHHYFPDTKIQAIAVPDSTTRRPWLARQPRPAPYHFVGWFTAAHLAPPNGEMESRHSEQSEESMTEPKCATDSPILTLPLDKAQNYDAPLAFVAKFTATDDTKDESRLYPDDVIINEIWINDNGTRYPSLDNRQLEGDWLELWVHRRRPIDLRGWRITDNDTKAGTDEGSLIFPYIDALAAVPPHTVILIVATESPINDLSFPQDDLDTRDGRMIFYVGNGNLDVTTDPGFGIGTNNDNVALLAPDPEAPSPGAAGIATYIGIDFVAEGDAVTPYTFGILVDGVTFDTPFQNLGADDGALVAKTSTLPLRPRPDHLEAWIVDPTACQSGDALCLESTNLVTPGAPNPGQQGLSLEIVIVAVFISGLIAMALIMALPKQGPRR